MKYNVFIYSLLFVFLNITIVQASDSPPVVAVSIAPVVVTENSDVTVLDLSKTFTDPEGYDITLSILSNTNTALVTPTLNGNNLTLTYASNQTGSAIITIQATADNETVETSFKVTVNPVTPIPVFSSLGLLASIIGLLWFGSSRRKIKSA